MSEPSQSSPPISLTVLPHSGKVEALKKNATTSPGPSTDYTAHANRIKPAADRNPAQLALEENVVKVLRTIFDPEIPVNIYDLGLIYDIDVNDQNEVHVRMTLTAPGCPVAGSLPPAVEANIESIPEVKSATVELVWDPQWAKEMMSEVARLELGM
jgi:FeS assembly SUF system protein